jgi:hypothetical protein
MRFLKIVVGRRRHGLLRDVAATGFGDSRACAPVTWQNLNPFFNP